MSLDVTKLLAVVKTAAAAFIPGAPAAIAAAEAVIDLAKHVRPTLAESDQAALDAAIPDLIAKMDRDVDQALATLRGE